MLRQSDVAALVNAVKRLALPVYLNGMARGLLGLEKGLQFRHMRKEAIKDADVVLLAGVGTFRDFDCFFCSDLMISVRFPSVVWSEL